MKLKVTLTSSLDFNEFKVNIDFPALDGESDAVDLIVYLYCPESIRTSPYKRVGSRGVDRIVISSLGFKECGCFYIIRNRPNDDDSGDIFLGESLISSDNPELMRVLVPDNPTGERVTLYWKQILKEYYGVSMKESIR